MKSLVLALCLALLSGPAARADETAGWAAYKAGNYAEARSLFEAAASADGYAAACRTGLVLGGFFESGEKQVYSLHRALDDCRAAIQLDPTHTDAHVSFGIGLGFEAKRLKKAKYAKASRQYLEDLLDREGSYGILHAALGGWHTSVYEAGFFARLALKAKRDTAREAFETAIALAPDDVGIRFEFIKYLAYGKKDERAEVPAALKAMIALPVRDAFDQLLIKKAAVIAAMVEAGDKDGLEDALEAATAFSTIRDFKDLPAYPLPDD